MFMLPKDETLHPKCQPKNFFIYGATMSGKSFFSSYFPHPLVLNTDGNSAQGTAPSIQIRNIRNEDGSLKKGCIEQLDEILTALQQPGVTYQTVVVDVIDDICVMMEQDICLRHGVRTISDIDWGAGYAELNACIQQFVMDLKALPMNIIYISRELEIVDEANKKKSVLPSLKSRYYNIVNGNCDLVVRTFKIGSQHYRTVTDKRADYKPEDIEDKRIRQLLESCQNMFKKN
ncbi:ATP-binding protein [Lactobacillus delbrueckii]|uniref:ATP-binding protein n=1 Tax=Lactobacillus delbrueckii TaxID=1584 RepID=UPI003A8562C8